MYLYMYVYGDSVHVTVCVRVSMHACLCYQTKLHTNTDYIRHCLQIAIIIGSSGILTSSNTVWYFIVPLYTIIHAVHVMPVQCGGCVGGSFGGCFCSLVWLVFEWSLHKRRFLLWYRRVLTGLIVNEELIAGAYFCILLSKRLLLYSKKFLLAAIFLNFKFFRFCFLQFKCTYTCICPWNFFTVILLMMLWL